MGGNGAPPAEKVNTEAAVLGAVRIEGNYHRAERVDEIGV